MDDLAIAVISIRIEYRGHSYDKQVKISGGAVNLGDEATYQACRAIATLCKEAWG